MEVIEFLQKTDHKNLKNFIGFKVKQKLQEYELDLQGRQNRLRNILNLETMQQNEELLLLTKQRVELAKQQRLDWINTKRIERQQAEEELLKVKKLQRELENCEEWLHRQSQQLLVETKEAQLQQIAEKRALLAREQEIERSWLKVMEKLRQEKEYQEVYEEKLRKVIEGLSQQKNLALLEAKKKLERDENEALKNYYTEDNMRALALDKEGKTQQKLEEIYKKMQQQQWLKSQIAINQQRNALQAEQTFQEDFIFRSREDEQICQELDESQRQKVRNKEWYKLYLEHCAKEKDQKKKVEMEDDQRYLNTGCVLQQKPKQPYGKISR
ncbi:reticulocyte-binding protein homolog 2a [Musca vetustissima]|uniref:reticulocyte-binding protein homolog 2a n=1 Tax=Musca vetustissima TaxID=27455 RepID=UPI002AB76952|nr:reticulocyte-binding protein homolog 2a [Musca vetustissima]